MRCESVAEGGACEKVLMDVADQILDYLVHVVVHYCQPLAPRCAEPLKHKGNLVFYLLVCAGWFVEDSL